MHSTLQHASSYDSKHVNQLTGKKPNNFQQVSKLIELKFISTF